SLELGNPRFVFGALRTVTDAQIPPFVLEIDVGTRSEERSELRIFENVLPLSGTVLFNSGYERVFFVLRPFLLLIPHSHSLKITLPFLSSLIHLIPISTQREFTLLSPSSLIQLLHVFNFHTF
ncbi:hypothetical protein V8G54_002970, partial [Vigna mungo]